VIAFLVAGVILGLLAGYLWRGPDHPGPALTVTVGVVGAVVGGVGMNLFLDEPWTDLNAYAFTMATVLPMVLLGLLEGGVGRP
jgi:uncharacterized membrane protein YeaQ/YmgE (transglycosylase-associated protein family)